MDLRGCGTLALACLGLVGPALAQDSSKVTIPVLVYNYAGVPSETLRHAQRHVGHIFRETGLEFEWHECRVSVDEPQKDPYCSSGFRSTDLALKILPQSRVRLFPVARDVAGFVPPGEMASDAFVFYDRLREIAKREFADPAILLGRIIAHEFGHLFKGPAGHSGRGVMRGEWTARALARASQREMEFSSEESWLIRRNALARSRQGEAQELPQSVSAPQ